MPGWQAYFAMVMFPYFTEGRQMKKHAISILITAAALAAPITAHAQAAPKAEAVVATAPGKAAAGEAVQLQGKVTSIDKANRVVVVTGATGNEVVFNLGEEVRNFDQIEMGDLVTLTYAQALILELHKVDNNGIRERTDSQNVVRAEPGEKPAGGIERTVRVVANVMAVDAEAGLVTLRGPNRTVELAVKDPAQLALIKVGDQVEALYTEAVAIEVTAATK